MSFYESGSGWSDKNEMRCLLIFKKLKAQNFPRGLQAKLCWEMAETPGVNLLAKTISTKVSDFKKVAKGKNKIHASANTIRIYKEYENHSISQLERAI